MGVHVYVQNDGYIRLLIAVLFGLARVENYQIVPASRRVSQLVCYIVS